MTATVNASTTSGVIVTSDTSGSLALQTANTTAIAISSAQVVTIQGLTVGLGAGAVSNNTVLGLTALASNTTGARNVAIGQNAFTNNSTATNTVAIGYNSAINITGGSNVSLGAYSLYGSVTPANNTGTNNVALGFNAMSAITSGSNNVAVGGNETMTSNATGSFNVGVGSGALQANTANYNTAVGYQSGYAMASGSGENVFIGYTAGNNNATGVACNYVGSSCRASSSSVSYEFVFAQYLTGKGTGTFLVGGLNGSYNQANNASWSTTSDQRLKKNIVDNNVGLESINSIRVRNFEYRTKDEVTELPEHTIIEKSGIQLGVIAQELQQVLPDCVTEQSTGVLSVNSDNILWHMVNAVKELSTQVTELKAEVQALKGA